ncbi:MAG: UDP-N-acetylmuramoyl-L-alanyl-D-glutamate--2,6-diaminopimelate ligase [Pontiella sp.]|nr:UDP-N-acetylmuramoyl-L-alanyl-D-glutamate--2,6-diaminopimelate ligase [Pontiella sp.]
MKLSELLESITVTHVSGTADVTVEDIAYDSRQVKPGGLFVAVHGHQVDGATYITEALSKGAAVVVSENQLELGAGATHVQVPNARCALAEMASVYYGNPTRQMQVVGVTGTNGKTTTTYMIRDILQDGGFLPGLLGTVAYEIGDRSIPASRTTPEAPDLHAMFRQMKDAGCDSVVMEVSSHALALDRVRGVDFNICVFTNLTQDHLDYHHDMENYFKVKAGLFQDLQKQHDQSAIINLDDPWGQKLLDHGELQADVVTYGFDERAMVRAAKSSVDIHGTRFRIASPWGESRIHLKLLGRFNIYNALAAVAVGGVLGIPLERICMSLERITSIPGRLEPVPNRKKRKVFVDYAHTDDALKNVLSTLREICEGRLLVVFGCGGNRDRDKRVKMGRVAAELADYSIVTSDNPRTEEPEAIVADIIEGFGSESQFEVRSDRREAIERGMQLIRRKDILLIAGKGHETYQEFNGTIVPFDDREVVREIFG